MSGEGFGPHNLSLSVKTLEKAFEIGIRHFDTASFYGQGRSEELLAKVFRKKRTKIFISAKGGLWREGRRVWHDARPDALRKALTQSLRRLGTDYIDLFQLHWPDPMVPVDESLDAIRQFLKEGLVRFAGAGNLSVQQIKRFIEPGALIPHQVHFNPVCNQGLEALRAGREGARCINCVVSPFEQGLLASPVYLEKRLGKKDVRNRNEYFKDKALRERLFGFFERCKMLRIAPSAAIMRWLLARPEVDIVIPGPRKPEQVEVLVEGMKLDEVLCAEAVSRLLTD